MVNNNKHNVNKLVRRVELAPREGYKLDVLRRVFSYTNARCLTCIIIEKTT